MAIAHSLTGSMFWLKNVFKEDWDCQIVSVDFVSYKFLSPNLGSSFTAPKMDHFVDLLLKVTSSAPLGIETGEGYRL